MKPMFLFNKEGIVFPNKELTDDEIEKTAEFPL